MPLRVLRPFVLLLLLCPLLSDRAVASELKPQTRKAFDRYVFLVEQRLQAAQPGDPFLWVKSHSLIQQTQLMARLKAGEVVTEKLLEKDSGREVAVPDGMLHHWIATVFVPNANVQQTLTLLQDYDHHKDIYRSEVVDSKLLSRDGNRFRAYMRFYKKKVIGVTLNTEHAAEYFVLNPKRASSRSHTTRIAEVENAGEKEEHEKTVGKDGGFLWALNSYWRIEEADGGVYVQCEAVSLTRDIPAIVGWMVKPFVTEVPRESLYNTLNSTRSALLQRLKK
ncbi:MAG TPA: hypothetical protein VM009_07405 [Terriglobales bacterium]|nr:hypothetical protein [Terriglobales bacterium]